MIVDLLSCIATVSVLTQRMERIRDLLW